MKKFAAFLLTLLISLGVFLPAAYAEGTFDESKLKADSIMLVDVKSGDVLYQKDETKKVYPASTTKILTSLLVLEKEEDLSKKVTVGKEVIFPESSSRMGLKQGETISYKDLLYGLMVVSGNDAAAGLAVAVGGDMDKFMTMMNEKAKEIGMKDSNFVNPHGLNNAQHYTTAQDMATLTLAALKIPEWKKIFTTKKYDLPKTNKNNARTLETTDRLLTNDPDNEYYYQYAIGGKTGLTGRANNWNGCLVALAKKGDTELLALIFGDHDNDANHRFGIAKYLFDTGFANFSTVDLKDILGNITVPKEIEGAAADDENEGKMDFGPDISQGIYSTVSASMVDEIKNNVANVLPVPDFTKELKAPITKGDVFGTITYKYNDKVIASVPMIAMNDMAAEGEENTDASASTSASASKTNPTKEMQTQELLKDDPISLWWLMVVPVVLGIIILIRVMTVNKKRRTRYKNKRKVYNYRIK